MVAKPIPTDVHDASFVDTAPLRSEGTYHIPAPAIAVFNCLSEPTVVGRWLPLARSWWTSAPPYGLGSTRYMQVRRGRSRGTQMVVEWEPGERIAFCNTDTVRFTGVRAYYEQYTIVATGPANCDVTLRFGIQLRPILFVFESAERVSTSLMGEKVNQLLLGRIASHIAKVGYNAYLPPA